MRTSNTKSGCTPRSTIRPAWHGSGEWLELSQSACGTSSARLSVKGESTISNYALCHRCGIIYATSEGAADG